MSTCMFVTKHLIVTLDYTYTDITFCHNCTRAARSGEWIMVWGFYWCCCLTADNKTVFCTFIHTLPYCGVYLWCKTLLVSLQRAESCAYIPAAAFTCTMCSQADAYFYVWWLPTSAIEQGILRSALTHTAASYACKSPWKPIFYLFLLQHLT